MFFQWEERGGKVAGTQRSKQGEVSAWIRHERGEVSPSERLEWVRTRCQELIIQVIRELGTRDVKQKAESRRGYKGG